MNVQSLHAWRVSYEEAIAIQQSLRQRVRIAPLARPVRLVAGTDVAYSRVTHTLYAAVVVVELPSLAVIEISKATGDITFPYIPGLLTFREVPPLLKAFRRLRTTPHAVLFDGHGLAHPRRFGLACHAGVLLGLPSVGCAKSLLVGEHDEVGTERGAVAELSWDGSTVGVVLRTRARIRPVYVSPGHLVDIGSAVNLVLASTGRFRIPEPIRLAHQTTTAMRRQLDPQTRRPHRADYPNFVRRKT